MLKKVVSVLVIALLFIEGSFACSGYKAKLIKVENCEKPSGIINVGDNFELTLTPKCEILVKGCVSNKDFGTAVVDYKIQKDGILLKQGKADFCKLASEASGEAQDMISLFGAPKKCPVKASELCNDENKISLGQYKSMLTMLKGKLVLDANVSHDTGKSCIHVELEISK